MKWTVSSFTSEHLQQSLQHCNESISYEESTGYGGRSSATGNGRLPQHRDRCGRWVLTHLQQEHADFQASGLPLQKCKQESNITLFCHPEELCDEGSRVHPLYYSLLYVHEILRFALDDKTKTPYLHTNRQTRQGKFSNAPRRIHEFVKEF